MTSASSSHKLTPHDPRQHPLLRRQPHHPARPPPLPHHFPDASVYLDPPFNSNRSYNVLFRAGTFRQAPRAPEERDEQGRLL